MQIKEPLISVVISTRGRPEAAARCVASVLGCRGPWLEMLVVDQSDDAATRAALGELLLDPRLRYLPSPSVGLSVGRNLGIECARGEWIACTDDDCEVPPDWLDRMAAALQREDRTAVVFGNVQPARHDAQAGFIPGLLLDTPRLAQSLGDRRCGDGMSACLGLKRRVWEQLGGFDELLGAGAPFRAAEDMDFAIRALLAGFSVYSTPDVEVIHHGFRTWAEGRVLIHGYLYGIGAMAAKHLKCRNWGILRLLAKLSWRWAFTGPVVELGRTPSRTLRLGGFLSGMVAGLAHGIDHQRSLFPPGGRRLPPSPPHLPPGPPASRTPR